MKTSEYEAKTRAINARVYGVFVIASIVALIVCPLVVILTGRWFDEQWPVFGFGLIAAALTLGVPIFVALDNAGNRLAQLNREQREEMRAENVQEFLRFKAKYHPEKEAVTNDESQDHHSEEQGEARPGDPE